ncbi:Clp protease N-terminal domain-containing protein [Pseudonocardia lacus]|uniref:Clp protease N-terminal domain-containing protein n=1 Tax=Pseudonocardia lacus TaxID=2835865 RepID=UPI001BDD24E2|nr:Clp protease N-terminal domain-containing protein [Pseudonocardia lacus]
MFERFNTEARQVVVMAQETARELAHHHIGTEHVLLALLKPEGSAIRRSLEALGLSEATALEAVLDAVPRGTAAPPGHIAFTPRSKKVLQLSLREALARNDDHIGPEHLLLGILTEGEGVGAQILLRDGRTADRIRQAVLPPGRTSGTAVPRTPAAEEVLARAEALAAGAPVGSQHLLEALAMTPSGVAGRALADLGVTGETLSARIDDLDVEGTGDSTPELAAAATMTLAVDDAQVVLTSADPDLVARVTALVEQAGGPLTGKGPLAGPFIAQHRALETVVTALDAVINPPEPAPDAPPAPSLRERLRRRSG